MGNESKIKQDRILIIDDDRKLCRLIQEYLQPMGYEVVPAYNGHEGLEKVFQGNFDAVILDVMMPGLDGFEVLQKIRKKSSIPVLMLTMRGDESDRIVGLEMGADDYLPKTFSSRELLARLRAVMRRSKTFNQDESKIDDEMIEIASLQIDPISRTAKLDEVLVELTAVEFDLLIILAKAVGRVFSREQLLDRVANREYEVFDRSIDVHISSLRRKLGDNAKEPRFIKTVWGVGYMFLDPSREQ